MGELSRHIHEALQGAYDREGSYGKVGALFKSSAKPNGLSSGTVCALLRGKYGARDLTKVESLIAATLLDGPVSCPIMGEITSKACYDNQHKQLSTANKTAIDLYRACRTCPNRKKENHHVE
ncbi:MAG: hypothetical protein WD407_08830 [Rhodospirillales bacterium]